MHDARQKAGAQLPKDKACNYPRAAGMNRAEMRGVTINNISRTSKHDINDKLNSSCMSQAPENTMHGDSGHFVHPEHEPHCLPILFMHVPQWIRNKGFCKLDKCREQCKSKDSDKTLSAVNFLLITSPFMEVSLLQGCKLQLCLMNFS